MDEVKPIVTVIMSVRNGEQWLREAIDSIIRQTLPEWEMWIIDDASTDSTWQILESYITDRPEFNITIMRQDPPWGLTKNLNTMLPFARGEFIARMDADDISEPERFAKQVAFLRQNPSVDAVASFITMINEKGETTGIWADDRKASNYKTISAIMPRTNCIAHPTVMIRASLLKKYQYNESQIHTEDWDLWLRLINDGKIIEKINEPLLLYRVHSASVTSTYLKKSAFLKKNEFYRLFLSQNRTGAIISTIRRNYQVNRVKLFLSRIKRRFTS
jgi:glycosyltransferase involved in cell wall biosynthesis